MGIECYEKTGLRRTKIVNFIPAGGSHAINTTMCIGNRFIRAQYTLCPHTDTKSSSFKACEGGSISRELGCRHRCSAPSFPADEISEGYMML